MTTHTLFWFRSDLRILDNPALHAASVHAAATNGGCIAVYTLTETQWDKHDISPAKRSLIVRQVRKLNEKLQEYNIPLVVINCKEFSQIPKSLLSLCQHYRVEHVFLNCEYELNEKHCADKTSTLLKEHGISTTQLHDQCIIAPGNILNQTGEPFKVYSAFKRAFLNVLDMRARRLAAPPKTQEKLSIESDLSALDTIKLQEKWQKLWPAGEDEAHRRLSFFVEQGIQHYAENRDLPAIDGTSTLSPYLAVGAISTLQCLDLISKLFENALQYRAENGAASWLNEIIWREFYRHLLDAFPNLCKHKAFVTSTENLHWKHDPELFTQWCQGNTGYPIVDAAMKQLHAWGWMHNRLRMVVAMFLSKHLFIDWRLGEKYFMQHLVDGDFASNNGGWQWSASTGVDAVPWFRIFNPTRQSQRFDSNGDFIRRYLPQLAQLDSKSIHQPSAMEAQLFGYPLPIVDHKAATSATKAAFKALSTENPKSL